MRSQLSAQFSRGPTISDDITCVRSAGTRVSWRFPSYRSTMPHDLVHLVVESGFDLRRGFWGRVDEGVDPGEINAEASRQQDQFRGFGAQQTELLMAEGLATTPWFDTNIDDIDLCAVIGECCASFGVPRPPATTPEQVAAVRAAMTMLRERWRQLAHDESLVVPFDVDDPRAGLCAMLRSG